MRVKRTSVFNRLTERVWQTIKRFGLLKPRDSFLLGVSGGPDSVAMLLFLRAINEKYQQHWRIEIAHLNHLIRAKESDRDEVFVRGLARRLGLKVHTERVDIPGLKQSQNRTSGSVESIARIQRYEFLDRIARKNKLSKVAVGHTRDDQAETVLLRILRGCGLRGLRGVLPKRPILAASKVTLIRPLLQIDRDELEKFLQEQKQSYRLDSSNLNYSILRNRVRGELFPYLARYNKGIRRNLARLAQTGQEAYGFLETEARRVLKPSSRNTLKVSLLKKLQPALQIALLSEALRRVKKSLSGITAAHYQAILSLLTRNGGTQTIHLPGNLVVHRVYDTLKFGLNTTKKEDKKIASVELTIPGQKRMPKYGLTITSQILQRSSYKRVKASLEEMFDLDKITQPLTIRYRKLGDKFQPLGMKGTQSLKKFLINTKIPQEERDTIPLLIANNQIIWVIGHRMSESVKVTGETKRILRLSIKPL